MNVWTRGAFGAQGAASMRPARPLAAMVDARYPRPDEDSGSLDQISYVKIFRSLGFDVAFAAVDEFDRPPPARRAALEAMGVRCAAGPEFASVKAWVEAIAAASPVFFLSRVDSGARCLEDIRRLAPRARVVFNAVDLRHLREARGAWLHRDPAALALAWIVRGRELRAARLSDAVVVSSSAERDLLARGAPSAKVFVIPLVREGPFERSADFSTRAGIGFIGGFSHAPNVDAVAWFLDAVWPVIRSCLPGAVFYVIGSNLPARLARRADAGVEFVGHASDIEPWLARLRLTVAPLRFGAGAKGKVVSSLTRGVPCVATPVAAEGMGLVPNQGIVIAGTPEQFVDEAVSLYREPSRWMDVSESGLAFARGNFSLARGVELTRGLLAAVGAEPPAPC